MTGMPVANRQPNAHPPRTAPRRPGMVWGALLLFAFFALAKAFLAVLVFATIRDDQVHGPSVPGGLWLFFVVLTTASATSPAARRSSWPVPRPAGPSAGWPR